MLSDAELKAMQQRCAEATPGPWKLWGMQVLWDKGGDSDIHKAQSVAMTHFQDEEGKPRTFDATFIAAARTDLPRLLDEIERLRRVEEAARKVHFWNESAEPTADLAFDDAMAELGKALEGEG